MYSFTYHRPQTLEAALTLLEHPESQVLAGGQTLIPTLKQRLAQPENIIDLGGVPELKGIREETGKVVIGAMSTHAEVTTHPIVKSKLPSLAALAGGIGDPQVRNRGTIGGSICNNDPAADYPAGILGLGATLETNKRQVSADEFFVDLFETALTPGELLIAIHCPIPDQAAYQMFPNPASRYAIAGVFIARFGSSVRVAVTGASACVFREKVLEQALETDFSVQSLQDVAIKFDSFNKDIHASRAYRGHLVGVMARKAVASLT